MKQEITPQQMSHLSPEKRAKLIEWISNQTHITVNVLSISDMIQFLYEHATVTIESEEYSSPLMGWIVNKRYMGKQLVDALWEAVKAEL